VLISFFKIAISLCCRFTFWRVPDIHSWFSIVALVSTPSHSSHKKWILVQVVLKWSLTKPGPLNCCSSPHYRTHLVMGAVQSAKCSKALLYLKIFLQWVHLNYWSFRISINLRLILTGLKVVLHLGQEGSFSNHYFKQFPQLIQSHSPHCFGSIATLRQIVQQKY
jgi:hypothetical protein